MTFIDVCANRISQIDAFRKTDNRKARNRYRIARRLQTRAAFVSTVQFYLRRSCITFLRCRVEVCISVYFGQIVAD